MHKDGNEETVERLSRWYFGGIAATAAVCITHPMDLLKVQAQAEIGKRTRAKVLIKDIYREQGIFGFYRGLSAALLRQLTYSTSRFGINVFVNEQLQPTEIYQEVIIAGIAGAIGGFLGAPTDIVNVRMQNDFRLPPDKRRNYKHVFHGLKSTGRQEGTVTLFEGSIIASIRGLTVNICQIIIFEHTRKLLTNKGHFGDNIVTTITASLIAGIVATTFSHGLDLLKTRYMNAFPGEYKTITRLVFKTFMEGPTAFFRGYTMAFLRVAPQTIFTFVIIEELKNKYGKVSD